jgi:hypothetical protein
VDRPANSNSSVPRGSPAEVRFIFSARARVTRLHTNSPVSWMLAAVSLRPPELNMTIGGCSATALKKL